MTASRHSPPGCFWGVFTGRAFIVAGAAPPMKFRRRSGVVDRVKPNDQDAHPRCALMGWGRVGAHLGWARGPACPSSRGNGGQDDQDAQVGARGVHLAYVPKKERYYLSLSPRCALALPPPVGAHLARCAPKTHTAFPPAHLGPAGALEPAPASGSPGALMARLNGGMCRRRAAGFRPSWSVQRSVGGPLSP